MKVFLPPLAAQFIRTRRPEAVSQMGDALGNRALALSIQHGSHNYANFQILENEWYFVEAGWYQLALKNPIRLQLLRNLLHQFLNFSGRWDEGLTYASEALEISPKIGRLDFIAIDSVHLAKSLSYQNHHEQAVLLTPRSIEIFTRLRMAHDLRWAQKTLAEIEAKLKENSE